MTPQSNFMVVAPIAEHRIAGLRRLLNSMNAAAGVVDPENALVPFGRLKQLHFARILILEDQTSQDIRLFGIPPVRYPVYVAFLGDIDGDLGRFLADLLQVAAAGLYEIFSYCEDAPSRENMLAWLKAHNCAAATSYVNWVGRTVQQIHEEAALSTVLQRYVDGHRAQLSGMTATDAHRSIQHFLRSDPEGKQISLMRQAPTPLGWWCWNAVHLLGAPVLLLAALPLLLLYAPVFAYVLRSRERSDPEYAPRIVPEHAKALARIEDHDVTNQFSAFGSLKPGWFRRSTLVLVLFAIDYTTRHIFNRGRLARVSTIHFARWTFLDNKKRLFFASNYDGSLDSYMDDFINKVSFGLNIVFSNGIGYPTTNWLICGGAEDELKFKYYIRRHELATEVWYKAYPGLTNADLERNALIRAGVEKPAPTDAEARQWLQLF